MSAITADQVPDEWISSSREIIVRDGIPIRGCVHRAVIEAKSIPLNEWLVLMLPGSGTEFATAADRDFVLRKIEGRAPRA